MLPIVSDATQLTFEPVDVETLRDEVEPEIVGRQAGQQGSPHPDAGRDSREHSITGPLDRMVQAASKLLEDRLRVANREYSNASSDLDPVGDLNATIQSAESKFEMVAVSSRQQIDDRRVEAERRQTDFDRFRREHDLTRREPHYPARNMRILMVGIVAILGIVESGANSAFLAKGNELGLIGAWVIAFGISALNIVSAFAFFGPTSRYLSHVNHWWRKLTWVGMALYFFLALGVNLGVAHYREVSGNLIGEAGLEVVSRMVENPWGLRDAESWLLFLLGVLFSGIAFYEGRTFDDLYPEYGRRDRSMREARTEYLQALDDAREELEEIREDSLEEIRRIVHSAREQPEERRRIAAACRSWIAEFDQYAAHLQQVGETLIDEYRQANFLARQDKTVPAAHKVPWNIKIPRIERVIPVDPPEYPTPDDRRLQEIESEYRSATDRIGESCKTMKDSLTSTHSSSHAETRSGPQVVSVSSGRDTPSIAG